MLSPGKVRELRTKKLQELRELQCLRDQSILTEEEFAEQKRVGVGTTPQVNTLTGWHNTVIFNMPRP